MKLDTKPNIPNPINPTNHGLHLELKIPQFIMRKLLYSALLFLPFLANAQLGGSSSFDYLSLPTNAKQIALGAYNITASAQDVNMFLANPALLADSLQEKLSFSFHPYYADAKAVSLAYAHEFKKAGVWGMGIQNIGYGDFELTDASGAVLGSFDANELALTISHGRKIKHFALGASMKLAQSNIANYSSSGLFFDVGGAFLHPTKDLRIGWAVKNAGFVLSSYTDTENFEAPLDVQVGFTFKPKKMPLRVSLTAHHLQEFDIAYDDPSDDGKTDALGNPINEEITFADKLSRHFVIGGEFVISKNLNARFGYNFLRRRELALDNRQATTGFSYGCMLRIKKMEFAFSRSARFIGGGVNAFTLILNTKEFFKKKRVIE
ncbi:MAG: hypothetical protein ACI85I_000772 [Arenicella sp.]|jgi:hypothetical protein